MSCCHEEIGQPRDLPDIKNPAGISHYHRHFEGQCKCGCNNLRQKVADLEYNLMQIKLQLEEKELLSVHFRVHGGNTTTNAG